MLDLAPFVCRGDGVWWSRTSGLDVVPVHDGGLGRLFADRLPPGDVGLLQEGSPA